MIGLLITLISATVIPILGAPATYDQRQDGKLNLNAKLENFLIVVATPSGENGNFDLLNDLAGQVFELKSLNSKEDSLKVELKSADVPLERSKDPSGTDVVKIEKDAGDKNLPQEEIKEESGPKVVGMSDAEVKKTRALNAAIGTLDIQSAVKSDVQDDASKDQPQNLAKESEGEIEDQTKDLQSSDLKETAKEGLKKQEETSLSNLQDDASPKIRKIRRVWSEIDEIVDPRGKVSLKKVFARMKDQDLSGYLSRSRERNEVDLAVHKPHELKLLGGSIENCGPGRFRDRLGVCRKSLD
ncbi:uncharacterized protein LOC105698237 [Orussus abietinus]|uniref:uncharacterized protein LOC105698237 n=1 Tax=Orussus abietinus TaxID=222816 RepID=UPI00062515DE|nr:uncharacterized protein LOC105698237 [Orussus abietinus]